VLRLAYSLGIVFTLGACAHLPDPPRPGAAAVSRDPYVEALVARARALDLAGKPQWHKLLHYRQGLLGGGFLGGGVASEADGAGFFLSPLGKLDPRAELDATLRGLFLPATQVTASRYQRSKPERGADAHPLCRFPARFMFLQRELAIDVNRLPVTRCPMLEQFLTELNAQSVTLIFSAYYLNNPASAFGHTFLRFNKAGSLAVGERRELLDYGLDFSADVDTGNALLYAIKGLTGMFPGTFKRIPYFYKVREYNDYEARDLWEYELALDPQQLTMLTAHVWELGHTYFAYFYLSENCSYHILAALEVARPELDLVGRLVSPVIPADTVKVVHATPGLVRNVSYRPSLRKQFEARARRLTGDERALVEELAQNAETGLPGLGERRKIAVLDAAADLVDVLYARDLIHKEDSTAARRKQRILERRAEILKPSQPLRLEPPWREAPEHGHGSRRVAMGAAAADGQFAPTAEFRLSLHDLADPSDGYLELSAIEFMRARVQVWPGARLELDEGSIFRVTSLTPQTRFDRKVSWELDVGATSIEDRACDRCLATQIAGGAGMTFALFDRALALWAMAHGAFLFGPDMEGLEGSHVRLGIGPSGGVRLRFDPDLIALVTARWLWLPAQDPETTYDIGATLRWQAFTDFALGVEARRVPVGYEGLALTFVYF
jgi:Domain of unknown function (DUF4105)